MPFQQRDSVGPSASLLDLFERVLEDRAFGTLIRPTVDGVQRVPVNMFETEHDLMVFAPLPGLYAEDIEISVSGNTLSITGKLRGPRQEDREYIRHEWHYGPYQRKIELPFPVDVERATATFDNGVLTVNLPKAAEMRARRISLRSVDGARGARVGHTSHHQPERGLQAGQPAPPSKTTRG